jgi:hypothetical protein
MGSIISEMKTPGESNDKCFDALLLLPVLVGGKLRKRDNAGNVIDVITPKQSCDEDEIPNLKSPYCSEQEIKNNVETRSIAESHSSSETQSLGQILEDSGVSQDEFFLIDPRCIHDPVGLAMAQEHARWERPAKRPNALYPSGVLKIPAAKIQRPVSSEACYQNTAVDAVTTRLNCGDVLRQQDGMLHSTGGFDRTPGSAFQVKRNLFIPISDCDGEDSSSGELVHRSVADQRRQNQTLPPPFLPKSLLDDQSVPKLPKITLKPRKPPRHRLRSRHDDI